MAMRGPVSDVGVGTLTEPRDDEPPIFEYPSPNPGGFDAQASGMEGLVMSVCEQMRDDHGLANVTMHPCPASPSYCVPALRLSPLGQSTRAECMRVKLRL